MLLGTPGVKADTWIRRFVAAGVGHQVTSDQARDLVMAAALNLGEKPTDLDHAIWSVARTEIESDEDPHSVGLSSSTLSGSGSSFVKPMGG